MATDNRLQSAITDLEAFPESEKITMGGGKKYIQVKDRLAIFRKHFGAQAGVITTPIQISDSVQFQCVIQLDGVSVATGHSEEIRGTTAINKKAAVEKAETSSIGRALACLGLIGGEFASVDEMLASGNPIEFTPVELTAEEHLAKAYELMAIKSLPKGEHKTALNTAFAKLKTQATGAPV